MRGLPSGSAIAEEPVDVVDQAGVVAAAEEAREVGRAEDREGLHELLARPAGRRTPAPRRRGG